MCRTCSYLVDNRSSSETGFGVDKIGHAQMVLFPIFQLTVGIESTLCASHTKSLQCFHAVSIPRNKVDSVTSDLSNYVST